jgi:hypothetical protein
MARGFENLETDVAEFESFALVQGAEGIVGSGGGAKTNGRTHALA